MSEELPFDPFPYIENPHYQTIVNSFFNFFLDISSDEKIIQLPDGDRLSHVISTPRDWKPTDPTVVLIHGLCGSHKSANPARMARRLTEIGIRAVRFNMRNCGTGKGLAKKIYHSGRSEDVFETLKELKREHPKSPIIVTAFSLGANITLKLAGELASLGKHFLKGAIAVSPPVDLYSSVQLLDHPDNSFYQRYFYRLLRADVHYLHKKFKDLPPIELPKYMKLYDFDQFYTAPQCGFIDAEDYYSKCSSAQFVPDIEIPCKILLAKDDPIVSSSSLDGHKLPSNVCVFKTKKGGHMGYVGHPRHKKGFYWLDSLLVEWILDMLK